MTYCSSGTKATVNYIFGNNPSKIYTTDKTPISIDTSEKFTPQFSGGQCPVSYRVTVTIPRPGQSIYTTTFSAYGNIESIELIYSADGGGVSYLTVWSHGAALGSAYYPNIVKDVVANLGHPTPLSFSSISIVRADAQLDNCGNQPEKCKIKISHNNQVIFSDRGDCPIDFSVICGEECPPGTVKCFKSEYPGYCCLPCSPIKAEIKAIASQIRRFNNG